MRNNGKATKKPVEVDYCLNTSAQDVSAWIMSMGDKPQNIISPIDYTEGGEIKNFSVRTLEGSSYEVPRHYVIIRGVNGEYYPCEPSIFKKTYNIQ